MRNSSYLVLLTIISDNYLALLGLHCYTGFSLVAINRDYSLVAHGLSCSVSCAIFRDQELNSPLLHWQADS